MQNRLLENWLDSASERGYQQAFCQMLTAKGHTVLHSTRHSALEYGKDVISLDSKGSLCAYQLKGNPGSRLTLSQFREIQNQLVQLVTQPPNYPDLKIQSFETYLVTNGTVDEEVYRAIDDLNRGFESTNSLGAPLRLIQRGELITWATNIGAELWPTKIESINKLLQLLVEDGKNHFDTEKLHHLLCDMFELDENSTSKVSANSIRERISSAAILTSVSLKNFELEKNHFEIIIAWTMFSTYSMAACEKHNKSFKRNAEPAVVVAREKVLQSLGELISEVRAREHLVEGNALVDSFAYKGRYTLLVGLFSLYWLWRESEGWLDQEEKVFIESFLPRDCEELFLWGEGAVPQYLAHLWYLRKTDASYKPDAFLARLLRSLVKYSLGSDSTSMPSPYYKYEDTVRHILSGHIPGKIEDAFQGDSFGNSSYYSLSLMHLLVRTNMKQTCKWIWPDLTKLGLRYFLPAKNWMYCLSKANLGEELLELPKLSKQWSELQEEARSISAQEIPESLKNDKFLLLLHVVVFPYRGTPSAIRYLGRQFNECWFLDSPVS